MFNKKKVVYVFGVLFLIASLCLVGAAGASDYPDVNVRLELANPGERVYVGEPVAYSLYLTAEEDVMIGSGEVNIKWDESKIGLSHGGNSFDGSGSSYLEDNRRGWLFSGFLGGSNSNNPNTNLDDGDAKFEFGAQLDFPNGATIEAGEDFLVGNFYFTAKKKGSIKIDLLHTSGPGFDADFPSGIYQNMWSFNLADEPGNYKEITVNVKKKGFWQRVKSNLGSLLGQRTRLGSR